MNIQNRLKTLEEKLKVLNMEGESWLRSPVSSQVYKNKNYYRVKKENLYQWIEQKEAFALIKEEKQRAGIFTPICIFPFKDNEREDIN